MTTAAGSQRTRALTQSVSLYMVARENVTLYFRRQVLTDSNSIYVALTILRV